MMKLRCMLFIGLVSFGFSSFAQIENYKYKRHLSGISETWHSIIIPTEMFGDCNQNLTDIRIFGFTKTNDTIEAPYILKTKKDKTEVSKIAFKRINTSKNEKGYFFSFKLQSEATINHLKLNFNNENFDWKVTLEGSQDQNEWFTILDDYRILSIKNSQTDYQFTDLKFPNSKYRYFRLLVKSKTAPKLNEAYFTQQQIRTGDYRDFNVSSLNNTVNKETKQTIVDVKFDQPVRASELKLFVKDTFDYHRHFSIRYLKDSTQTERGWKKNFITLGNANVSSLERKIYTFNTSTLQHLQLIINNSNNRPLEIDSVAIRGPVYALTTRLLDPADYYLVYGKPFDFRPNYDIQKFKKNIPEMLKPLELGKAIPIESINSKKKDKPLFENPFWLYGIMVVIILVLGIFSVKMIKSGNPQ